MFKVLTIIFFTYYLINIFKQHNILMQSMREYIIELKEIIIKKQTTILNKSDKETQSYFTLAVILFTYLIFQAIEFVYVVVALSHDPYKYPSFAFLVFWVGILLISSVKKKTFNPIEDMSKYSVDEAIEELDKLTASASKYQIKVLLQTIVDISFFGYMIYILFLL